MIRYFIEIRMNGFMVGVCERRTIMKWDQIAQEILESIGCSPGLAKERKRIATASGYEMLPVVWIQQFSCLGQCIEDGYVLAHTLPFGTYVDGLLGMDFMQRFPMDIRPFPAEVGLRNAQSCPIPEVRYDQADHSV